MSVGHASTVPETLSVIYDPAVRKSNLQTDYFLPIIVIPCRTHKIMQGPIYNLMSRVFEPTPRVTQ
jgi:hypothetical protein